MALLESTRLNIGDCPVPYSFEFAGDCLGDVIPHGSVLLVEPEDEIRAFDLVSVLLKSVTDGPWAGFVNAISDGGMVGVCKIYLGAVQMGDGELMHLVGQLKPPVVALMPECALLAIHKIDGDELEAGKLSEEDQEAMKMMLSFAMLHGWQPAVIGSA